MSETETRGEWYRDTDGVWRNPRYPSGKSRAAEGPVDLSYDPVTNEVTLSIGEVQVSLTFWEIGNLIRQATDANRKAQDENSRLWKEKEAIMIEEGGYTPPHYTYRGR